MGVVPTIDALEEVQSEFEGVQRALKEAQNALEAAIEAAEELDREDDCDPDEDARQAAIEAISQIRRGASTDAIETLERHLLPKWADADEARRAYRETMEASNGTHNEG